MRKVCFRILCVVYAIFWIGGVLTSRNAAVNPAWASPAFLAISAAIVILAADQLWPLLLFALAGFLSEVIGVATGLPFGAYSYTPALGPGIAAVPLAIACAWLTLLAWARDTSWRLTSHPFAATLIGAALMTAADLLIDPVATRTLHFWKWTQTGPWFGVPLLNFVGWFVVSAALLAIAGKPKKPSATAAVIGVTTLAFFALIAILTR